MEELKEGKSKRMKRKHKQHSRPKRPFDKARIEEEAEIKKEFGLKNKKEIWRAEARIKSIRKKAKKLIFTSPKEQQILFNYLKKMGFSANTIGDILSLDKKDYLNRRLQTIVAVKGLAPTMKSARQLIIHKKVLVNGEAVNSPSYIVPVELENRISLKESKKRIDTENKKNKEIFHLPETQRVFDKKETPIEEKIEEMIVE